MGPELVPTDDSGARSTRECSSSRNRCSRRSGVARIVRTVGLALLVGAIVGAPLAAGGVHRATMICLMIAVAAGVAALTWSAAARGDPLRIGVPIVLPLILLLIPIAQSIPIPSGLINHLVYSV